MKNARGYLANSVRAPVRLFLASSNPGKFAEYRALARAVEPAFPGEAEIALELLPRFESLPAFAENAPTFAENAAGKALHYSRFCDGLVFADDSGLVVPVLCGAPGVLSARYAGAGASSAERNARLLEALRDRSGAERRAQCGCGGGLAERGLGKGFAEISAAEKNEHSHRGRAFRKLLAFLDKAEPSNIRSCARRD